MPRPDLDVVWEGEEFLHRVVSGRVSWDILKGKRDIQVMGVPIGKVTSSRANVGVEERIAAKDVGADPVPHVIGRVAREVDCFGGDVADGEYLVVI